MPQKLLWIVKDASSEHLSHSARLDESRIRRHAQIQRPAYARGPLRSDKLPEAESSKYWPVLHSDERILPTTFLPLKTGVPPSMALSDLRLTDAEARGIEFYIHRTARECCGWQDEHFWNVLVLQAGHSSPGITHALISISAWHRALSAPSECDNSAQISEFTSSQWLKTLACGRKSAGLAYSTCLIHCVVLACLQAHRSDYQDFRLLRSAAAMLRELDVLGQKVSEPERRLIDSQVRPLVARLQAKICTMGDLPAALKRSAQIRQFHGLVPRECPCISARFSTLRLARDALEAIFNWAHDQILEDNDNPTPASPSFHHFLNAHLNDWHTALYAQPDNLPSHATALLRLASLNGLILIRTCTEPNEIAFDAHISTFRTMMQIINSLTPTYLGGGTVSFGIDSGLVDIVAFVATRCREPCVRHLAIRWLQTASRIEGDRLSLVSARIALVWRQLEEGDLARSPVCAADIPEWRRWRLVQGARYHAKGLVKLKFTGAPFSEGDEKREIEVCFEDRRGVGFENEKTGDSEMVEGLGLPDVLIGRCSAAFLEDRENGAYHCVQIERFWFPIPRV